ncbi:MAG: spore coat protein YlbD [Bacillaceae bacterium]
MSNTKSDKQSSVQQFKQFVKSHPKLRGIVRNGEKTWQELFEEWYLLGDNDPTWKKYREGNVKEDVKSSADTKSKGVNKNFIQSILKRNDSEKDGEEKDGKLLDTITGYVKKMDPDQIQSQITNVRSAIENIQKIVAIFNPSGGSTPSTGERKETKPNPFTFRKD